MEDDGFIYVWDNHYGAEEAVTIEDYIQEYYIYDGKPKEAEICMKNYLTCNFVELMDGVLEYYNESLEDSFYNDNHDEINKYINNYLKDYYDFVTVKVIDLTNELEEE